MRSSGKHTVIVALALIIYMANTMWIRPVVKGGFVGSAACASCHAAIYATHIHTAHYLDSRPAGSEFIKGSFDKRHNRFTYNSKMEVVMEKKGSGFFQTAYFNGGLFESESIDIVIGSGRKGQTYLYWDGDRLFQLPISYYTPLNTWCNSPGYPTNLIYFNKQVGAQCFECHGTYAKTEEIAGRGTVFDKNVLFYGIDCERCHGAGADHVAFHTAHPGEKTGRYILNAAHMSRQQRLDACALCHSGLRTPLRPPLTFQVGDTLDNFSTPGYAADSVGVLDVHANQYGLLTSSKCFLMSQMDCSSCHNVHVNDYNNTQVYSTRCMNCHNDASHSSCTMPEVKQLGLYSNCIDCHMPALPSRKIMVGLSGSDSLVRDLVRTHRVGIYPASSKTFLGRK